MTSKHPSLVRHSGILATELGPEEAERHRSSNSADWHTEAFRLEKPGQSVQLEPGELFRFFLCSAVSLGTDWKTLAAGFAWPGFYGYFS